MASSPLYQNTTSVPIQPKNALTLEAQLQSYINSRPTITTFDVPFPKQYRRLLAKSVSYQNTLMTYQDQRNRIQHLMQQLAGVMHHYDQEANQLCPKPQPSQVELVEVAAHQRELKHDINALLSSLSNVTTSIEPESTIDVYQAALQEAYDILLSEDPTETEHEIIIFPLSLPQSLIIQSSNGQYPSYDPSDPNSVHHHSTNTNFDNIDAGVNEFLNDPIVPADLIVEYKQGAVALYLRPRDDDTQRWTLDIVLQLVHPTSLIDSLIQAFSIEGATSQAPSGGYLDQSAYLTALRWAATYIRAQDPLQRELSLQQIGNDPISASKFTNTPQQYTQNGSNSHRQSVTKSPPAFGDTTAAIQRKGSTSMKTSPVTLPPPNPTMIGSASAKPNLYKQGSLSPRNGYKQGSLSPHGNFRSIGSDNNGLSINTNSPTQQQQPPTPLGSTTALQQQNKRAFFPSPNGPNVPSNSMNSNNSITSNGPSVSALVQRYTGMIEEHHSPSQKKHNLLLPKEKENKKDGNKVPGNNNNNNNNNQTNSNNSNNKNSTTKSSNSNPQQGSGGDYNETRSHYTPSVAMSSNGFNDAIIVPSCVEVTQYNNTALVLIEEGELSYNAPHEITSPTHAAFYGATQLNSFDKQNIENGLILDDTPYLFSRFQTKDDQVESLRLRLFFGNSFQEYCDYFGILKAAFDHQQAMDEAKQQQMAQNAQNHAQNVQNHQNQSQNNNSPFPQHPATILEDDTIQVIPLDVVHHGSTMDFVPTPQLIPAISGGHAMTAHIISVPAIPTSIQTAVPALPFIISPSQRDTSVAPSCASPRVPVRPNKGLKSPSNTPLAPNSSSTGTPLSPSNSSSSDAKKSKCVCPKAQVLDHPLLKTNIGFDINEVPKFDDFSIRNIFEYSAQNKLIPLSIVLRTCRHIMEQNHDQLWQYLSKLASGMSGRPETIQEGSVGDGLTHNTSSITDGMSITMSNPSNTTTLIKSTSTASLRDGEGNVPQEYIWVDPYGAYLHDDTNDPIGALVILELDNPDDCLINQDDDDDRAIAFAVTEVDDSRGHNHHNNKNNPLDMPFGVTPPPPPTHPKPLCSPTTADGKKKRSNLLEKAKNSSSRPNSSEETTNGTQKRPQNEDFMSLSGALNILEDSKRSALKQQPIETQPTSHAAYIDGNAQLLTPNFTEPSVLIPRTSLQIQHSELNRNGASSPTNGGNGTMQLPGSPTHVGLNDKEHKALEAKNKGKIQVPIATLCEIVSSIDQVDANGWTPLLYACFYGHMECVKLLLTFGANPDFVSPKDGASPLYVALDQHRFDVCDLLVELGVSLHYLDPVTKMTPLMFVAQTGNLLSCDYLIRHKQRISLNTATLTEGYTALCLATLHNHITIVDMLLVYKADINVQTNDGYTALMLACNTKNELIADLLISANAFINTYTHVGITALVCAITQQNYNLVYLLLSKHANPNPMKHRSSITPLIAAVLNNDLTLLQTLVQRYGAIVNTIDYQGRTALMHACTYNSPPDIIKFLISQGAELNIRDNDGKTSLALANEYGHHHLVRMLFGLGAKRYHLYHRTNEALQLAVINSNKRAMEKILVDAGNVNLHLNMVVVHSILPRDPALEQYNNKIITATNVVVLTNGGSSGNAASSGGNNSNNNNNKQQQKRDLLSKRSNLMDESDYTLLMYCIEKDSMVIGIDYHDLPSKWYDMALLDRGQYNYLNFTNNFSPSDLGLNDPNPLQSAQSSTHILHTLLQSADTTGNALSRMNNANNTHLISYYVQYDIAKAVIPPPAILAQLRAEGHNFWASYNPVAPVAIENNSTLSQNGDKDTGRDSGHLSNTGASGLPRVQSNAGVDDVSYGDHQLALPIAKHNNVQYNSNNIDPKLNRRSSQQFAQVNSGKHGVALFTPDGIAMPPPPPPSHARSKSPNQIPGPPPIPQNKRGSSLPPPLPQLLLVQPEQVKGNSNSNNGNGGSQRDGILVPNPPHTTPSILNQSQYPHEIVLPPTVHIQPGSSSSRSFGFHLQQKGSSGGKKELKFGPRVTKYNIGNGLGFREIIDLLLKHKVDVNDYTSNGGVTALMLCAKYNRKDLCKVLLKEPFYADINARDNLGRSVLGYAKIENNIDMANWLFGQGARM